MLPVIYLLPVLIHGELESLHADRKNNCCTIIEAAGEGLAPIKLTCALSSNLLQTVPKPLCKHAYSNILKISPPKIESFPIKILIVFILLLKT